MVKKKKKLHTFIVVCHFDINCSKGAVVPFSSFSRYFKLNNFPSGVTMYKSYGKTSKIPKLF